MQCSIKNLVVPLALLLTACASDDGGTGKESHALMPTAVLATNTQDGATNFKAGDVIWVWADRYGTSDGYIKAWKLTATGVDGKLESPEQKEWPEGFADLSIQAFHGEFNDELVENETELSSLAHTVSTEQGLEENRNRSDLLYAFLSPTNHKPRLTFLHMLSKIKIILTDTEAEGGVPYESITNADMKFNDVATTVKLDMETHQAKSDAPFADISLGTTTTDNHTAEAIIPPQQIDSGKPFFELTLHDFPRKDSVRTFRFVAPAEGISFEPGTEYIYTLSVKNLIRVKPVDIPWEWKTIENNLQWSKFFFAIQVMDWNGLREYSHQWAWINFSPTVEEWDSGQSGLELPKAELPEN